MNDEKSPSGGKTGPNGKPDRALVTVIDGKTGKPSRCERRFKLTSLKAIRREMGRVYAMGRNGEMTLPDCCRCTFILSNIAKVLELTEIETRVRALERMEELKHGKQV
jgi:hypothetical protein